MKGSMTSKEAIIIQSLSNHNSVKVKYQFSIKK